ncbi:hypothetical protein A4A71_09095 [Nicoletella semolina]|uniref:hypothetical protein n=1 Tax=Nicoletella semolina TaxID=271160 RepID=UPI002447F408|nr:hypothetical protein [Nicoletella semolina]MDH2925464.1 hypothetical protein [Nicoletella semolina]
MYFKSRQRGAVEYAIKQSSNQAIKQSSNQAIKQSSNQAIKQSSNQAIKQSSNQAIKQNDNTLVFCFATRTIHHYHADGLIFLKRPLYALSKPTLSISPCALMTLGGRYE